MLFDVQQGEVLALSVNVHQVLADGRKNLQRHNAPVDPADVASLVVDLTDDDYLAIVDGEASLFQDGRNVCGCRFAQRKEPLHLRLLGLRPDGLLLGALAKQQPYGIDDDGLTRSGLSRQHVQPGLQSELQVVNERKIRDCQDLEHRLTRT